MLSLICKVYGRAELIAALETYKLKNCPVQWMGRIAFAQDSEGVNEACTVTFDKIILTVEAASVDAAQKDEQSQAMRDEEPDEGGMAAITVKQAKIGTFGKYDARNSTIRFSNRKTGAAIAIYWAQGGVKIKACRTTTGERRTDFQISRQGESNTTLVNQYLRTGDVIKLPNDSNILVEEVVLDFDILDTVPARLVRLLTYGLLLCIGLWAWELGVRGGLMEIEPTLSKGTGLWWLFGGLGALVWGSRGISAFGFLRKSTEEARALRWLFLVSLFLASCWLWEREDDPTLSLAKFSEYVWLAKWVLGVVGVIVKFL